MLEQQKADYRDKLLRDEIADALGAPGTTPSRSTVDFDALNNNIRVFVQYLTEECRKEDAEGNKVVVQKETSYTGQRSSLTYLY